MPPARPDGLLFTDHYQFTMAQLYFRQGLHEQPVQFEHFFRQLPHYGGHQAGYAIQAGFQPLHDWMLRTRPDAADLDVLRGLRTQAGRPQFDAPFLDWLRKEADYAILDLDTIPEGRVVHPEVPLTVVRGPVAVAQLLESPLLAHLNYATLVATKAARLRHVARGRPILEFGLRRAQAAGANTGTRAALIGGATFSSNVIASHLCALPSKGTHAHSLVQLFIARGGSELDAFRAYAEAYPDDCLLLIDTIDTLHSGLPHAIRVFEELRAQGHRPVGVRLDSGDLAYLSLQVARELNLAGFPDTAIVLSNQIDEMVLDQILEQIEADAPRAGLVAEKVIQRLTFGVGTRLITSEGHSALDGVYKLTAIQHGNTWAGSIKLSETPEKTLNPGRKSIWRIYDQRGIATADVLAPYGENPVASPPLTLRHPLNPYKSRVLHANDIASAESLLQPGSRNGRPPCSPPSLEAIRIRREDDLKRLDYGVKRLRNPHQYHVSLSQSLWALKQDLIRTSQD